jgi:hypothetical protein
MATVRRPWYGMLPRLLLCVGIAAFPAWLFANLQARWGWWDTHEAWLYGWAVTALGGGYLLLLASLLLSPSLWRANRERKRRS